MRKLAKVKNSKKFLVIILDTRFTGGIYALDCLTDLKVSMIIKLNDNHFSFENQVTILYKMYI